jgi:hypothetical protein
MTSILYHTSSSSTKGAPRDNLFGGYLQHQSQAVKQHQRKEFQVSSDVAAIVAFKSHTSNIKIQKMLFFL